MRRKGTKPRRRQPVEAQLELEEQERWACRGIFSPTYLRHHLPQSKDFPSADDVAPLYDELKALWLNNYGGLRMLAESYTRTRFLDRVLPALGWSLVAGARLPKGSLKWPDYCLIADAETERRVAASGDWTEIFRASSTVLEAKKVEHPLDQVSNPDYAL